MPRLVDYATRWDLLRDALERILLERGARGLSVAAVAREAGLSPATLRRLCPTLAALESSVWLAVSRRVGGRVLLAQRRGGEDLRVPVGDSLARYLPSPGQHERDLKLMRLLEILAETDDGLAHEMRMDWKENRVTGIRNLLKHLGVECDLEVAHTSALVLGLTDMILQQQVDAEVGREVLGEHLSRLAPAPVPAPEPEATWTRR